MSSWARWTDDFLQNSVSNLIDILKYKTERRKKLTSGLYPVYSLWSNVFCWSRWWKIGLREPFSGWDGCRWRLLIRIMRLWLVVALGALATCLPSAISGGGVFN